MFDSTEPKQRIIQEFVPGKQVTIAHILSKPNAALYPKVGLRSDGGSIGVMTITPSEASILAADVAAKAADIEIGFVDRFNGALLLLGRVSEVEQAMRAVMDFLVNVIGCAPAKITKT